MQSQRPPHSRDDFKTDGWPPVPIPKPPPQPRPPWIELRLGFRLAPCLVLCDFKTDGWLPVPVPKAAPQPRPPWIELRLGFRLAPCLVLWDFKTDGWLPVPIPKLPPQPRPAWIELRLGFRLAPCLVLWDLSGAQKQQREQRNKSNPRAETNFCSPNKHSFSLKGVGGTRALAHSIRRCRAVGVAKLACYPGCCRCRRPPPSRCFLKVTLKNDALACISEHFCILKVSNLEKSEFSLKSFILLVFWRFLGILGESKNRQKTREIRQKITGRERRSSGTVFETSLDHFFQFSICQTL